MASLDPGAILGQLTQGFIRLPLAQKIAFPLFLIASVAGIIYVSKWASRPDYAVLFSDLSPTDSASVIERLKDQKIKYEVRNDGGTIAVSPADSVHELRITLAGEGVPKGGTVGYELFDATNFGMTSFVEKLKWTRAIQGELERTITALSSVASARVHITQPEKSVFAKKGNLPTASVMLKLKAGAKLEKKQIQGISNLVAGSVEGLTAENVTIVDVYGNLLTPKDEGEDSFTVEATRLQYQRELERGYAERIEQMLIRVLGAGKVVARVTTDLDFSLSEREEESFDPSGQVMRSERTVEEGTGSAQRGGVPGVQANLSNDPNLIAPQGLGAEDSSRKEAVKNYEVSRSIAKTSSPRGKLKRLSVAVLVDGTYDTVPLPEGSKAPAEAAAPQKIFKPLEPSMLSQIEGLVKNAVGFDSARGDTVSVENIPFHEAEVNLEEKMEASAMDNALYVIYKASPIVFIILFFFILVRPLVKFLVTPTDAEVDLTRLLPTGIAELEQELEQERSKASVPTFEPTVDIAQLEELMSENSRIVKENPQQAALLIRYWLNDGRL